MKKDNELIICWRKPSSTTRPMRLTYPNI